MARAPKFTDDEILDRAMDTFWRRGWSATSVRDLERTLELKAPSIYRRYRSKDGLGVAVIDHYIDRVIRRRVSKHLSGTGDPIDNITRFLELSVTQARDDRRLRGCLITTTTLEADTPSSELAAALERGLATIEDGLRQEVARAEEKGRLSPGLDPDAVVSMLTLSMQGLMALARGGASPVDLQERARSAVSVVAKRSTAAPSAPVPDG